MRIQKTSLRCSATFFTALSLGALALACDANDEAVSFENTALHVERNSGPSEAFLDAKRAIDESAFTIRQADNFEWPVLKHRLMDLASYVDLQSMSAVERVHLDAYAADRGAEVDTELAMLVSHVDFPGIEYSTGDCYTRCLGFLEIACENSQIIGMCAGVWGCDAEIGLHQCMDTPDSNPDQALCNGEVCAPGWRCARWAFKADECVQECNTNSDCPSSQKCKRPIGTSFKRCK